MSIPIRTLGKTTHEQKVSSKSYATYREIFRNKTVLDPKLEQNGRNDVDPCRFQRPVVSRCHLTRVTDVPGLLSSAAGCTQEVLSAKTGPFTTVRKNYGQEVGLLTSTIPHGQ